MCIRDRWRAAGWLLVGHEETPSATVVVPLAWQDMCHAATRTGAQRLTVWPSAFCNPGLCFFSNCTVRNLPCPHERWTGCRTITGTTLATSRIERGRRPDEHHVCSVSDCRQAQGG